jgi:uncharacterized protein YjbI with pentapeptide repeats
MELGLAELRGAQIERQDFLRADLSGRDLAGAVFRDCELRAACLDWANLEGARFDHARLMSATFRNAHLRGGVIDHFGGHNARWQIKAGTGKAGGDIGAVFAPARG